ncbi:MAG: adenylate/guanylate cyclase domain-containing protein [Putridiphycobacter sp.]
MANQIVNILLIDDNQQELDYLYSIIQQPGLNVFKAECKKDALAIVKQKNIGIILCHTDTQNLNFFQFVDEVNAFNKDNESFIIAITSESDQAFKLVKGLKKGAVDYISKPYKPNLVRAKIDIFRRIYLKNNRISRLLENIFPLDTLYEFNKYGKSTPKKHKNCTILFTDFVKFSEKARDLKPKELIDKLDYYFSKFDEIILKYNLEKIKTIGDAYMAVGGVTKKQENIEINTALAAIEIRNFIKNEVQTQQALGNDFWNIRIGLHTGDLIAGVIGNHKFSFDVWGDSVNVAARCEQNSLPNQINISNEFHQKIEPYFDFTNRGEVIIKNRGKINMHFLENIKPEFAMDLKGKKANAKLRQIAQLQPQDFEGIRNEILNMLKIELDDQLFYHSYEHTLNVEKSALKYAKLEGLSPKETMMVRTAALFHDAGFILQYDDNEIIGAKIFQNMAPKFGFPQSDIDIISDIILATNNRVSPKNLLEEILCDADHDYLGRSDYHHIANKLKRELGIYKSELNEEKWLEIQIEYLENKHKYYSTSAYNLRQSGKMRRINELKSKLVPVRSKI